MDKYYYVQYETKVTLTAKVLAKSKEEAVDLVYDGEYEDSWEDDSDGFHVIEVREEDSNK